MVAFDVAHLSGMWINFSPTKSACEPKRTMTPNMPAVVSAGATLIILNTLVVLVYPMVGVESFPLTDSHE